VNAAKWRWRKGEREIKENGENYHGEDISQVALKSVQPRDLVTSVSSGHANTLKEAMLAASYSSLMASCMRADQKSDKSWRYLSYLSAFGVVEKVE
jgi:hypothetical protein